MGSPPPGSAYVLPGMVLARKAKTRQHRIRLSLADALDLLVVSVEAGLGLDQALARVAQELTFAHPDLSSELRLVNLELLAGKARSEALRNLAERTGVDDLSSLVAMLVQTDKFGTSVANSLRVFSDTLRTKRRQRAEEAAAKTGVKMVFPLVVCIFPAIWIVTIGPAAIRSSRSSAPWANRPDHDHDHDCTRTDRHRRARGAAQAAQLSRRPGWPRTRWRPSSSRCCTAAKPRGMRLADRVCLPYGILEPLLEKLRLEALVEVKSALGTGTAGYRYALTDAGRDRARRYFEACGYVGPAPVPLAQYTAYMPLAARSEPRHLPRSRGRELLASHRRAGDARPARARPSRRAAPCSSTALPETARA